MFSGVLSTLKHRRFHCLGGMAKTEKGERSSKGAEKKAKNKFKEDDKVFAMDGGDLYEAKVRLYGTQNPASVGLQMSMCSRSLWAPSELPVSCIPA